MALEENLAALEGGKYCICTSSGMAACCLILHLLKPNDHLIASIDLYGGTTNFLNDLAPNSQGINVEKIDFCDLASFESAIKPATRMVMIETPTNPTLKVYDLIEIAKICKKHNLIMAVDNTFMSPYLQNPLALGADIVMHSCTKYIGGHADLVMGAVITANDALHTQLRQASILLGPCPSPFDCYLALRGVKTMALRIDASQKNAMQLAELLAKHPKIEECWYPGLASHAGHALMKKQARGFGGMITVKVKGAPELAKKLCDSLTLFTHAVSLGGVESLVTIPAMITHKAVPLDVRQKLGITDNMVRLSIGIEDYEDLKDDLLLALEKL
jgi:cystathionine gamma-lyase